MKKYILFLGIWMMVPATLWGVPASCHVAGGGFIRGCGPLDGSVKLYLGGVLLATYKFRPDGGEFLYTNNNAHFELDPNQKLIHISVEYPKEDNSYDEMRITGRFNSSGIADIPIGTECASGNIRLKLHPGKPVIKSEVFAKKHCANASVAFSVERKPIPGFDFFDENNSYVWYYKEQSSSIWHAFYAGNETTVTFNPADKLKITDSTELYFSVAAVDSEGFQGLFSDAGQITVLPPPPKIGNISFNSPCPEQLNGRIKINNIDDRGVSLLSDSFKYIARISRTDSSCRLSNLDLNTVNADSASICGWGDLPTWSTSDSIVINDVAEGMWRVYVTYADPSIRNCFTDSVNVRTLTVSSIPKLSTALESKDISCPGKNDGQITVKASGGSGLYMYRLEAGGQTDTSGFVTDPTYTFDGLSALESEASYKITVQDQCVAETKDQKISTPHPVRILNKSGIRTMDPTCRTEPDGKIDASTWDIDTVAGQKVYYKVTNSHFPYPDRDFTGTGWLAQLHPGSNTIMVYDDAGRKPGCPAGDTVTISLRSPDPLVFGTVETVDLTCFGRNTGEIKVDRGSGGSQTLSCGLLNTYSGAFSAGVVDAAATFFSGLPPGTYQLTLRNSGNRCSDSVFQIITVRTPPEIETAIASEDVLCKGENNGRLRITRSGGGTGKLSPRWQKWHEQGLYWDNAAISDTLAMRPGAYRLIVEDGNGCLDTTDAATISEPGLVLAGTATVNDIVCYGDLATFSISAGGGNADQPYTYQYDNGDGQGFRNFDMSDRFDEGLYTIRVLDRKGCSAIAGNRLPVTGPSEPFTFTYTLSNYHDFNISCHGNNNGWISVQAGGGNGGGYGVAYSGYTYTLDALTHDDRPLFENLYAGDYVLTVSDRRGCSGTAAITLIQPASGLAFNPPAIQNVLCHDHSDGSIALSPLGGAAPYAYRMDGSEFTSSGFFGRLAAGEYTFTLRDNNNCTWTEKFSVIYTIPEIELVETTSHVNCFGGSDGFISIHASGGLPPLQYLWKETQSTETTIRNLATGRYTCLVTDAAGCSMTQSFPVGQPEAPLVLSAYVKPVCVGASDGLIRAQAAYGTAPYRYAIDQTRDFAFQSEFTASPGMHQVYALDANNCLGEISVETEVKNRMPSVNFMAATLRYAMDTLVLKEVSVPRPDSVFWSLSPGLNMTGSDQFEPVITSDYPGQYAVQMTGWFDGCDYAVDKLLQFSEYDPAAVIENDRQKGIRNIEISPNPSQGDFRIKADLYVKQQIILKIVDMGAGVHFNRQYAPADALDEHISLPNAPPGMYILTVITEHDARAMRIVIN